MNDYISRADFRQTLINTPFYPRCQTTPDLLTSVQDRLNDTLELLDDFPPADVIPRATIEAGSEEAIARLNAIRGQAIEPADVLTAKEKAELIKLLEIHVKPVAKVVLNENYYSLWSRIEFCLNASICADMRSVPPERGVEA